MALMMCQSVRGVLFSTYLSLESMLQGAEFIQDHAQRPDVRFCVVSVVFEHLWAHVVGGAGKGRCKVRGSLEDPGDTKVP